MTVRRAVGVLGGTFDPVHFGHLSVAEHVRLRTGMDRVLFLPAACPPHKTAAEASAAHRAAMIRLAIEGRPGLELSEYELRGGVVAYTIDTLRRMRREMAEAVPVFLLGMDALRQLPTWKEPRALLAEFDWVVVDRADGDPLPEAPVPDPAQAIIDLPDGEAGLRAWQRARPGRGGRVFRVRMAPVDIASREVRSRAAAGADLGGLVPPAVARYIEANHLYRQEGDR